MRPLKLTLSAFGPYAKEEFIDFTKLNGKNIFLITGVTGAGKTTIFDAISYALFGEASGTSREVTALRSHFAKDNIYTYVELEFEVKGNLYYIKRSPEQEVAKLRGDGTTKKNSTVELRLPKGENPLTKVNEVNEKIREIIGVDKEQFRQIVMLPQGEFRQLLEAKSTVREEIFREIFGTQSFLEIQKNLREKRNKLKGELIITNSKREVYIKGLKAPEDSKLYFLKEKEDIDIKNIEELAKEVISSDKELAKVITLEIEKLKNQVTLIENEKALINENNTKIVRREKAEEQLKEHKKREDEIEQNIITLNEAKRALDVKVVDDNKIALEKKLEIRSENLQKAINNEKLYKEKYDSAINDLKLNNDNEKLRNNIKEEIVILTPYEEKIKIYEEKKHFVSEQQRNIKFLELQKNQCDKEINLLKLSIEELLKKITSGLEAEGKYKALKILIENDKNIKAILFDLYKNYSRFFEKQLEFEEEKKKSLKKEEGFKKQRAEYQEKEDLFRKAQAGILAEDLRENMPCPVCGSTNHPNKSKKIIGVPTEEQLKKLKISTENKEKDYNSCLLDLKSLNAEKETLLKSSIESICNQNKSILGQEFFSIIQLKEQQEFIKSVGVKLKNKINSTENEIIELKNILLSKAKNEKDKETKEKELRQKEILFKDLIEKITDNKTILASKLQVLKDIEKEIPEEIRDSNLVKAKINELKLKLKELENQFKLAQDKVNTATTNYSSAKENLKLSNKEKEHILNEYNSEKNKLEKILKINEFESYEHFRKSCLDKNHIELLENKINKYKEDYKVLLAIYEEFYNNTKGLEKINTIDLEEKISNYNIKEKELNERLSSLKTRILTNKENLKKINEISSDIKEKEDEFRIIAELEGVAYGEKGNLKKITFESYVLTSYFDEIIQAANIRLEKMSSGRFELKRKEQLGKGNKKQGLDLEVIDYHTGKARDVKTLSGGEGFKASLSLALGLADVIQSYAGGISIDTMFIDEGFGTLDPASLDNAIECLLSLQNGGRLVGIISHVPELKERIEAILEVKSDNNGSKTEFIIN